MVTVSASRANVLLQYANCHTYVKRHWISNTGGHYQPIQVYDVTGRDLVQHMLYRFLSFNTHVKIRNFTPININKFCFSRWTYIRLVNIIMFWTSVVLGFDLQCKNKFLLYQFIDFRLEKWHARCSTSAPPAHCLHGDYDSDVGSYRISGSLFTFGKKIFPFKYDFKANTLSRKNII